MIGHTRKTSGRWARLPPTMEYTAAMDLLPACDPRIALDSLGSRNYRLGR